MPIATDIKLLQKTRVLEVTFDDGKHFVLPCEYLRVYSPSAEVRGHGHAIGDGVLVTGKQNVNIIGIEPIGNYAVKLIFDDGHETGLYSWVTLYDLGVHQEKYWQQYLSRIADYPLPNLPPQAREGD